MVFISATVPLHCAAQMGWRGGQEVNVTMQAASDQVLPMWVVISSILERQPRKPWNSPEGTVARRGSPEIQGWANASELAAWLELEALVSGEFKFLSQTGELSAESGSHRPGSSQRFTKSKPKKYFLHLLSFFSASF